MNTRQFVSCLFLSVLCLALAISKGNAQTSDSNGSVANRPQRPKIELPVSTNDERVAGRSAVFCAGYVRNQKFGSMPELVGALEEQEKHTFSTGDVVYISWGSTEGIKEGQEFQIIRPRGEVKNVHQNKKGSLGVYVEEVGQLQVLNVREHT